MLGNYSIKSLKCQKGQALILSVFLVLATAMASVLMYNNGQVTSEKSRLVNAADAAAYSGGIYFARNLNFLAYTNRAMIANHVAMGHFVSYVSWIRYLDDALTKLSGYTAVFPNIGAWVITAERVMSGLKEGTENIAPTLVKATGALNSTIANAQRLSQSTMNGVLSVSTLLGVKIMDKVGKSYHPTIRVNHSQDVNVSDSNATTAANTLQINNDIRNLLQYVKGYKTTEDDGRMKTMIENSYDVSSPWIRGNRGWRETLWPFRLQKAGSSQHKMEGELVNWEASDDIYFKIFRRWRWRGPIVASGKANVREFDDEYKGVSEYYDLRNRETSADQALYISALATMPISSTKFMGLLGLQPGTERLAALSRAEILHKRPDVGFNKLGKGEYSNLYNPFWQVRLSKNNI